MSLPSQPSGYDPAAPAGADIHRQPTCFGCGTDNPAGLHGSFEGRGTQVLGTMLVTEDMVGAPGRLHGGIMMAFFDEGLGLVCHHLGVDVTASLTVDLRAPAFVGATLRQRAWLERHEGRKWFVQGEVHEGDRPPIRRPHSRARRRVGLPVRAVRVTRVAHQAAVGSQPWSNEKLSTAATGQGRLQRWT